MMAIGAKYFRLCPAIVFRSVSNRNQTEKRMSNEFNADERASEKRMRFDSEIEPRYFDQWLTERYGKGTILKEAIGDAYASEEEAMESFFDSMQRSRSEG